MDIVLVVGRVLFALLLARAGVQHLRDKGMMAGYAKTKGVPLSELAIPLTGVMLVIGAISIAFGIYADIGALLLLVFLVPTALMMHNYWDVEDPQERVSDSVHFYKDVSLAGAALVIFYLYTVMQTVPDSVTHALLHIS